MTEPNAMYRAGIDSSIRAELRRFSFAIAV